GLPPPFMNPQPLREMFPDHLFHMVGESLQKLFLLGLVQILLNHIRLEKDQPVFPPAIPHQKRGKNCGAGFFRKTDNSGKSIGGLAKKRYRPTVADWILVTQNKKAFVILQGQVGISLGRSPAGGDKFNPRRLPGFIYGAVKTLVM